MSYGELILIISIDFLKLLAALTESIIQFMRKIITFTHFLQGACWQHLSNNAVEETTARKEALKAEVTDAIAELTATIASDKDLLAKAPKGKEGKPAVEKAKAMCKWLISWSGKRDSNLLGIIL